jgi:hypothetical protein
MGVSAMKALPVKKNDGQFQKGWQFGTFKATQIGVFLGGRLQKPRHISGWQIQSPDGCKRFSEGNWQQFVPFANLILDNYGIATRIS